MIAWVLARRLPLWFLGVVVIGVIADLIGGSALPLSAGDGSAVPVVAVVPALTASVVVGALDAPMRALDVSFPRTTRLLEAAWLIVGNGFSLLLLLPVVSTDKSAFTPGDLLRNVAIFVAAAAVSGAAVGARLSWVLPAVVVVTSFIPSADAGRHWWAPAVWSGSTVAAQWPALLLSAGCCVGLVVVGADGVAERLRDRVR